MKILFIKLGALGDVINTLPLAVALKKHTGASVHWLVAPLSYPLVSSHEAVDKTILFEKNDWYASIKKVRSEFKKEKYDIVLDLQRTLKSGLFTMLAKGDRKIGFDKERCKEMTWILPFERITPSDPMAHMLDQYLEFGAHLDIQEQTPEWQMPVFGKLPSDLPETYIILNTGATKAANKWFPSFFAELADKLFSENNIRSVLTGGPEDAAFAEEIIAHATSNPVNMVGKTSVGELTEVIRNGLLTVSCDTGPMHLAVACDKPVVALFGPSNPDRTGPYKGNVISGKADCTPCNKKECSDPICMRNISPEQVYAEITKMIKNS